MAYEDLLYDVDGEIATITINRPDRLNAFTGHTIAELVDALKTAWGDRKVAGVILTGAGEQAFCAGGDQKAYQKGTAYGGGRHGTFDIEELHLVIRNMPKPVVAAVNGYAIGGGHVLHVLCDISIAAEHARFGQVGPRVGSFDMAFGAAYLAQVVGQKRATEMWFLCRQYSAQQAKEWGLVNEVVPKERLMEEARTWAGEMAALSPTAIRFLKQSFNAATSQVHGLAYLGEAVRDVFRHTEEAWEGRNAFKEKRKPDFSKFR